MGTRKKKYPERVVEPGEHLSVDFTGDDVIVHFTQGIPHSYARFIDKVTGERPKLMERDRHMYSPPERPTKYSVSIRGKFYFTRPDPTEYVHQGEMRSRVVQGAHWQWWNQVSREPVRL